MKLRVGIVGLGESWETRHRAALRSLADRFEVRAICAEVAHLAERAARDFHAVQVDGFRALAARDDVDAVLVLSPDFYGSLPVLAASEAGKAVYCADTFDLDPFQALRVKERVERSGVAFMAEFPRRLHPATLRLKELIATRLGPPRLLFCHARLSVDAKGGPRRPGRIGSQATHVLVELIDWCRYVVGSEPTSVFGVQHVGPPPPGAPSAGADEPSPDVDYQMMSLDFSARDRLGTGPLAQISCGHYMPAAWPEAVTFRPPAGLQVACERGIAFIDLPSTLVWFDSAGRHQEALDSERPVGEQLLMMFHRAVTSLVRKIGDLEDAHKALQVLAAARSSFAEDRRVWLDGK